MPPDSDDETRERDNELGHLRASGDSDEGETDSEKMPMERIDILAFPIDVDSVLQHLHRDMRDDWFEDVLQHRDLFASKRALREVLHEVLIEGNGR